MHRYRVILNPKAGSTEHWPALCERIERLGEVEIVETKSPDDAAVAAAEATDARFNTVIAAGGDGTVNRIVNGLMRRPGEVVLGIVPLGTGNDLPRTLGIPLDPLEAIDVIAQRHVRTIDLMHTKWPGGETFAHNVAAGGFTGQMNEALSEDLKARWGPLAYLRGAINVLPDLTQYKTFIRYDGKAKQPVAAMNVIIANGRTAGGGTIVAPLADPTDGLLDVVVVRTGTKLELAGVAARLIAGDYTHSDAVTHQRAKRVEVESTPGMWFNVDGELVTNDPIVFSVEPAALKVIVGPDFERDE